jgi:superoxide reductase
MGSGRRTVVEMQELQVYKCLVCDTTVEVLDACGLELVCCGPPMVLMQEKMARSGHHPHAILFERNGHTVKVKVGNPSHPTDKHHRIAWIELLADGCCLRRTLKPNAPAEATFHTQGRRLRARFFCTQHGLWSSSPSLAQAPSCEETFEVAGAVA